jgi:hypothetical protein
MLVGPGLAPGAAAEVLVVREAVEDTAVIAEMVEGIDMRASMGIHRDRVPGIGDQFVAGLADAHDVVGLLPARRVRHPDLVGLVLGAEPAGHPDEIVNR